MYRRKEEVLRSLGAKPDSSLLQFVPATASLDTGQTLGTTRKRGNTDFIRCSMNVCRLTSSVKIVCAVCETPPYVPAEVCVVDGLSFDSRKRACEPPASQTMKRGSGKRSVISS